MKSIRKILCVIEPNSSSETALIQASRIAENQQAELTFLSVLDTPKNLWKVFKNKAELDQSLSEAVAKKQEEIENWLKQQQLTDNYSVDVVCGKASIETIKKAISHKYDLVVKSASHMDWLSRLFGNDDMDLLRKCPCPVLILKTGQHDVFRNVLATVDVNDVFSDDDGRVQEKLNDEVLEYSTLFSLSELTSLHIGSVWDAFGEDFLRYGAFSNMPQDKVDQYVEQTRVECSDRLESIINDLTASVGKSAVSYLRPKSHLVKGVASKEILEMVNQYQIDLVVLGTVARTGIPGLLIGNTAESTLEQIQCSVLAIKPEGFIAPV